MLTRIKRIIKDASSRIKKDIDVFDLEGKLVCTSSDKYNYKTDINIIKKNFNFDKDMVVYNDRIYQTIQISNRQTFLLSIDDSSPEVQNYVYFIKIMIETDLKSYNTKLTKEKIFNKIIHGQVSDVEIYEYLNRYNLKNKQERCVLLIKLKSHHKNMNDMKQILSKAFPQKSDDYLIIISNDMLALIKSLEGQVMTNQEMLEMGEAIVNTILSETYENCIVGIGSIKYFIKDLYVSYQEAQMALNIGRIFSKDKNVFSYQQLSLEKLLYQLNLETCLKFYNEVFGSHKEKLLDDEQMVLTIEKFFQNSLNLSETSRQLYIHRNTLVYRLDKIQKITGLDLRNFDDAVTFKFIMMINSYIKYKQNSNN